LFGFEIPEVVVQCLKVELLLPLFSQIDFVESLGQVRSVHLVNKHQLILCTEMIFQFLLCRTTNILKICAASGRSDSLLGVIGLRALQ
jgi:hypothetical protein